MNDTEQLQRRMLAAARLDGIPRDGTFDRIRQRIAERADDDELEPAWQIDAAGARVRWTGYAIGALVAAAVALALLWWPRLATEDAAPDRDAAAYDRAAASPDEAALPTISRDRAQADSRRPAVPAAPTASPRAPEPAPPSPSRRSPRLRSGSGAPAVSPEPAPNVAGETVALGRARAALERGELGAARTALRAYRSAFPAGVLAPEADGLAAIVACRADDAGARSRAARFAAQHPSSPMIARVRTACESSSGRQTEPATSRHP